MSGDDERGEIGARSPQRESFASFRARLDAVGFKPSRRLGQNFLLDPTLHRAIVEAADVDETTTALEIGVGLGFLTRELCDSACAHVVAAEIDERLADLVEHDAPQWPGGDKLTVVRGDALAKGGGALAEGLWCALAEHQVPGGRFAVVANLPYATSGPLLAALATGERAPDTVVALIQLELAERITSRLGESERGGLTILLERFYEAHIVRRVGREVFRPRPNVDSAVVRLRARTTADGTPQAAVVPSSDRRAFAAWLRALFAARRKMLGKAVRGACKQLGLEPPASGALTDSRRPEELSAVEHWSIWESFGRRAAS